MIRVHREVVQVHPKYALPSLVGNNGTAYFGGQLANEPHHATESSSKRLKHSHSWPSRPKLGGSSWVIHSKGQKKARERRLDNAAPFVLSSAYRGVNIYIGK